MTHSETELLNLAVAGKHPTHTFDEGERNYFRYQLGIRGGFHTALYRLISLADQSNRHKLQKGFPDEVLAYLSWTQGNLAERLLDESGTNPDEQG